MDAAMSDKERTDDRPSLKETEKWTPEVGREAPTDSPNALAVQVARPNTNLAGLFEEIVGELTREQLALEEEGYRRLKRYKFTRGAVALFMCLGVITTLGLNIQSIGLDMVTARVSPIVITGALFFYILEALLRDHEVSWECAREASRLKSLVRRTRVEWVSRNALQDRAAAVHILNELNDGGMKIDSLIAAEKVLPIQDILKRLQGKKPSSRHVQKS
jgi:hypothetical protein